MKCIANDITYQSCTEFTQQLFEMLSKEFAHLPVWRLMIGVWPFVFICDPEEAEVNQTKCGNTTFVRQTFVKGFTFTEHGKDSFLSVYNFKRITA